MRTRKPGEKLIRQINQIVRIPDRAESVQGPAEQTRHAIRAGKITGTSPGIKVYTTGSSHYPLPQRSSRRRTIHQLTAVNGRFGAPSRLQSRQKCISRENRAEQNRTESAAEQSQGFNQILQAIGNYRLRRTRESRHPWSAPRPAARPTRCQYSPISSGQFATLVSGSQELCSGP